MGVASIGMLLWATYNSKLNVGEIRNFCCYKITVVIATKI